MKRSHWVRQRDPRGWNSRRRGVAVVVVLGLIAVCLGLSYAVMRSQASAVQVQQNSRLRAAARNAAEAGLSAGLRRMHQSNWAGVGTTLVGTLSPTEQFTVQFHTGDAALDLSAGGMDLWPYRVTLVATGHAVDPASSGVAATHRSTLVVQLLPRGLSARPANWTTMLSYTLFQWGDADVAVQVPMRVEGRVWLQGSVQVCSWYPQPTSARSRYLSDLNSMRTAGLGDFRPFTGPIWLPFSRTTSSDRNLLTGNLGISLTNVSVASPPTFPSPLTATMYQLYPGGESYSIPPLGAELQNTTLEPDPRLNPLGLFRRSGNLRLHNNVNVRGTLLVSGSLELAGSAVLLQAAAGRPLEGSDQRLELPVAVVGDDFKVLSGASAALHGLVVASDYFEAARGTQSTQFHLQGRVVSRGFGVYERTEWNMSTLVWQLLWTGFNSQEGTSGGTPYFPQYLTALGLTPQPRITLQAESGPVEYHWKNRDDPVYQPAAGDEGLRWSIVRREPGA